MTLMKPCRKFPVDPTWTYLFERSRWGPVSVPI
jgi:hypothetical protein